MNKSRPVVDYMVRIVSDCEEGVSFEGLYGFVKRYHGFLGNWGVSERQCESDILDFLGDGRVRVDRGIVNIV